MTATNQIDMITANGHVVNFEKPEVTVIDPDDLRIHIQNICRYNGAVFWPLAKHLALCAKLAINKVPSHMESYNSPTDEKEQILQAGYCSSHDFQEYVCTDVVSGLKKYLPAYRNIERRWEAYVHRQLGLPLRERNEEFVRHVDRRALVIEMTALGHPASELVALRYGGTMTGNEELIFSRIKSMSTEEAWHVAWKTFEKARSVYMTRNGYTVEMF